DLDHMRASPLAQQLLAGLQDAADNRGNAVVLTELQNEENGFAAPEPAAGQDWRDIYSTANGPGKGTDATVMFNPSFHGDGDPSVATDVAFPNSFVVLHHELSHAYHDVTGTIQPAVHPDPDATDRPAGEANPVFATENGIRGEMGLPDRPVYRTW